MMSELRWTLLILGVVFIAATADSKFRAFDSKTGKELWTVKLPAADSEDRL